MKTIIERKEILKNMIIELRIAKKEGDFYLIKKLKSNFRHFNLLHTLLKKYLITEEMLENKMLLINLEEIILNNKLETKSLNISKKYKSPDLNIILNYYNDLKSKDL